MFNYQIIIEYLGTNFVGWQIQKNGISIQSTIQKALSKAIKKGLKLMVLAALMQVFMLKPKVQIFYVLRKLKTNINF